MEKIFEELEKEEKNEEMAKTNISNIDNIFKGISSLENKTNVVNSLKIYKDIYKIKIDIEEKNKKLKEEKSKLSKIEPNLKKNNTSLVVANESNNQIIEGFEIIEDDEEGEGIKEQCRKISDLLIEKMENETLKNEKRLMTDINLHISELLSNAEETFKIKNKEINKKNIKKLKEQVIVIKKEIDKMKKKNKISKKNKY